MKTKGNFRHGSAVKGAVTRTYKKWLGIRRRLTNPKEDSYPLYGGRGIKMCERWNDFSNFLADMGEAPEGMSIDRIDSNGDYEPGNCRWTTTLEQVRNRRNTLHVTLGAETKTLKEWSDERGLNYKSVWSRIDRGLSPAEALIPGKRKTGKKPNGLSATNCTSK